jgi:hypothetical protein
MLMTTEKPFDFLAFVEAYNARAYIVVYGAFDMQMAGMAEKQVQRACAAAVALGQSYATFVIDSRGELGAHLERMQAYMEVYRPHPQFRFVGYVTGFAYGRALDLLQYCDWRVAHVSTSLQMSYGSAQLSNIDQAMLYENDPEFMAYERGRISDMIAVYTRRAGLSVQRVQSLCGNALPFTARQALAMGLIDELIDNLPTRSTRPDYTLRWGDVPSAEAIASATVHVDGTAPTSSKTVDVAGTPATSVVHVDTVVTTPSNMPADVVTDELHTNPHDLPADA